MFAGPAVCAKGFTLEVGAGAYWMAGPLLLGPEPGAPGAEPGAGGVRPGGEMGACPVEAAGERGSPAGVPHAAQNFREPMSSAPHFAQWIMEEQIPCSASYAGDTRRRASNRALPVDRELCGEASHVDRERVLEDKAGPFCACVELARVGGRPDEDAAGGEELGRVIDEPLE